MLTNSKVFLSVLLLALGVLHILLSWKWVKTISKRLFDHRWKKMLAATSLAWIVVLFIAWLAAFFSS